MEKATAGFWNKIKARWYRKGLEYSNFASTALPVILTRAPGADSFLDVGSGCGTLAIPLAKKGKRVTALDPSPAMIEILKEDIKKEGLKNIKPVLAAWGDVPVEPHDAVICANVPALLKESTGFLEDAVVTAKKAVFLIESAGPYSDKFFYKELYPLIFGRPFGQRIDYLKTYNELHAMGVFANVEIIEYDFDQPFDSLEEALIFWKEYMGIVTEEHDADLGAFLEKRLVRKGEVLLAKFHKKAAVIWWRTDK
ncbi:MAG: class I SAM-dependent methyltransferase [Thermodesulfobacteriota bacterium]